MKKLILLLFFGLITQLSLASHFAGGQIWYEHIPDSLYTSKYRIYLLLARDQSGASMCASQYCTKTVCIKGAPNISSSLTLNLVPVYDSLAPLDTLVGINPGAFQLSQSYSCINAANLHSDYEFFLFSGEIVLPNNTSFFEITYQESARSPSDNLLSSTGQSAALSATANLLGGPNSTVIPRSPFVKAACLNKITSFPNEFYLPDNDSIYFSFSSPKSSSNCSSHAYDVNYASGYSPFTPLGSQSQFYLDHFSGEMSFMSSAIQNAVVKINIQEYRYNSLNDIWYEVGSIMQERMLTIGNYCSSQTTEWDIAPSVIGQNSQNAIKCGSKFIRIELQENYEISTLSPDGSDFGLLNYSGNAHPIKQAIPADTIRPNFARSVKLMLHDSLYYDDTLKLFSRLGNDLNTLINECGNHLIENDTVHVIVNTCNTRMNLTTNEILKIQAFPNPTQEQITIVLPPGPNQNYTLQSLSGHLVKKGTIEKQRPIDLSSLPPGIYILSAGESNEYRTRIIKQ